METLRTHRLLLAVVLAYVLAGRTLLAITGLDHWWEVRLVHGYLLVANALWACGLAVAAFANARLRRTFTSERVGGGLILLALTPVFIDTFSSLKQALWWLVPFTWDSTLARVSEWVHGGWPAYAWIEPILTPSVLRALDTAYILWFLVMLAALIGCAWSVPSSRRLQALLAFTLAWVLIGTGAAALFGSVGPCYVGHLVNGPNPYALRLARLQGAALVAPALQADLWANLQAGEWRPYSGVSAMPSMHVAVATWVALWLWPSRLGRCFGLVFLAVTQVASVALAWHYAIDGYVAIVLTLGVWWMCGHLARLEWAALRDSRRSLSCQVQTETGAMDKVHPLEV